MLDSYFFAYKEDDLENCMQQKTWPTTIEMALGLSKDQVEQQEENFKAKLEQEQNQFYKDLLDFDKQFQHIITFSSFAQTSEYMQKAYQLNKCLEEAEDKVEQFKTRENLFNFKEVTEYPKLNELQEAFKPFHELIDTANQVKTIIMIEYQRNPLAN